MEGGLLALVHQVANFDLGKQRPCPSIFTDNSDGAARAGWRSETTAILQSGSRRFRIGCFRATHKHSSPHHTQPTLFALTSSVAPSQASLSDATASTPKRPGFREQSESDRLRRPQSGQRSVRNVALFEELALNTGEVQWISKVAFSQRAHRMWEERRSTRGKA